MDKFLTLQYYFDKQPNPDFQFTKLTAALIVLLLALGIAIKIYQKKYTKDPIVKKMLKGHPSTLLTFGAILLFLLLAREVGLPILSMRIWWIILFLSILYWHVKILIGFKKEYRKRSKKHQYNKVRNKYLPKKKKGK